MKLRLDRHWIDTFRFSCPSQFTFASKSVAEEESGGGTLMTF